MTSTQTTAVISSLIAIMMLGSCGQDIELPVEYDDGRFFITPITAGGEPLKFYADTGGGFLVYEDQAKRLNFEIIEPSSVAETRRKAKWPILHEDYFVPPSLVSELFLVVPPSDQESTALTDAYATVRNAENRTGMLGAAWFADRVWTLSYSSGSITHHARSNYEIPKDAVIVPLGFQTRNGVRTTHFPRVTIDVNGEHLEMLFDTGAMTVLASNHEAEKPRPVTASFITRSIFEKWQTNHPDWTIIENAELGSGNSMILVPELSIGTLSLGPAWFTVRPDENFISYMSQWMDTEVVGALGGSALKQVDVVLDYPKAQAVLWMPN